MGVENVMTLAPLASEDELTALSDDDLFLQLKEHGVNAGPIVASTRPFYERKLFSMIFGQPEPSNEYSEVEDDEDYYEDDYQPSAVVKVVDPLPETPTLRQRLNLINDKDGCSVKEAASELDGGGCVSGLSSRRSTNGSNVVNDGGRQSSSDVTDSSPEPSFNNWRPLIKMLTIVLLLGVLFLEMYFSVLKLDPVHDVSQALASERRTTSDGEFGPDVGAGNQQISSE